jgi:hypothetical protein
MEEVLNSNNEPNVSNSNNEPNVSNSNNEPNVSNSNNEPNVSNSNNEPNVSNSNNEPNVSNSNSLLDDVNVLNNLAKQILMDIRGNYIVRKNPDIGWELKKMLNAIEKGGIDNFSKKFVEIYKKEEFYLHPEEFLQEREENSDESNQLCEELRQEFKNLEHQMHVDFYSKHMNKMTSSMIANTLTFLPDDIPSHVIKSLTDE